MQVKKTTPYVRAIWLRRVQARLCETSLSVGKTKVQSGSPYT